MTETPQFQVVVTNKESILVGNFTQQDTTCSISGIKQDANFYIPELAENSLVINFEREACLIHYFEQNKTKSLKLKYGQKKSFLKMDWIIYKSIASEETIEKETKGENAYLKTMQHKISQWVATPMPDRPSLISGLKGYLETMIEYTPASNGTLVIFDEGGMNKIAHYGIDQVSSDKLVEKIPDSITKSILQNNTRMILPDDLQNSHHNNTTIFLQNFHSYAGFPIVAENKVFAILFLGFKNLIYQLSENIQQSIEDSCHIVGMVVQRASLREQFSTSHSILNEREKSPYQNRLMIGHSVAMDQIYHLIRKFAPVKVPVIVLGETGVGKELAARELHNTSPRCDMPFVPINAAALPENLIESELFGHKKGAFTGAVSDRKGLIEQANKGTLFIDEIGELPLPLQAKLLRVLQEKVVRRVGDNKDIPVDFRLVTATHCNLKEMIQSGTFREDLYYRIAGAELNIPPLRERREDIILLANFFKKRAAKYHQLLEPEWSAEVLNTLPKYDWHGNIRELQNSVERAIIMCDGPIIMTKDLFPNMSTPTSQVSNFEIGDLFNLPLAEAKDEWMKSFLTKSLEVNDWNKKKTSDALGIGLRTLFRHIEQLKIQGGKDV